MGRRLRALARHPDTAGAGAALGATGLALVPVLRLWEARLSVPFDSGHDANVMLSVIKMTLAGGWYTTTDLLGAPFGLSMHEYPIHFGDWLNLALVHLIGLFTDSAVVVANVFYLLTYFLVAGAAYAALRLLGRSRVVAVAGSVLYTFLPYHWLRGEQHLFLAAYWVVPLAAVVLIRRLEPDAPVRPTRFEVGVAIALAGTGFYYAAFFLVLLALLTAVRAGVLRQPRLLAGAGALAGVVVAVLVVANVPTLLHLADEGRPEGVAEREFFEAEVYGLRVAQMVLPVQGHRVEALGDPAEELATTPLPYPHIELPSLALGALGALGVLALGGRLVARGLGGPPDVSREGATLDRAMAATAVAAGLAVAGGGATLLGLAGFTTVRAWSRIVVFVGFFAVVALAVYGDRLLRRRSRTIGARLALVAPVVLLGVLDQTTAATSPAYEMQEARWDRDEALVDAIEGAIGGDGAVFQLPHVPFPEHPPPAAMEDYDHLRGFLHSDSLAWSYGAVKGTEGAERLAAVGALPVDRMIPELRRLGYTALWLNRAGYGDPSVIEAQFTEALGPPIATAADGGVVVFEL